MRYRRFRIQNFKGIKDATVDLGDSEITSVYAFVGLNESGKTTILEAIHSFSPDWSTSDLIGGDTGAGVPVRDRVPRHLYSSFTGDVSVEATVSVSDQDFKVVKNRLFNNYDIRINLDDPPEYLVFERQQRFKAGDFLKSYFSLRTEFQVKTGKQKNGESPRLKRESKSS